MPIKKSIAPSASLQVFKTRLRKTEPTMNSSGMREDLTPHKVYHASAKDLAAGKGLTRARQVAWRYLHTGPGGQRGAHEVRLGKMADEHHFNQVQYGQMVEEINELLAEIGELEALQHYQYELALLRLYMLRINAVWLRAAQRKNDYFIPLSPCFHGLQAKKLYPAAEFLKIVEKAAKDFLATVPIAEDDLLGG